MDLKFSRTRLVAMCTLSLIVALLAAGFFPRPSRALPVYARRYGVTCQTCHTVAPHLNLFGLAFQANHFQWPGGPPPAYHRGLEAFPISGLATFSQERTQADGTDRADFRTLELYLSDSFRLGGQFRGGYFLDDVAAVKDARAGDLEDAFATLSFAGERGQWALTAGQLTPITYQYDSINSLTDSLPVAVANDIDAFSFTDANPGVRLEFFDHRGLARADGNYASVGVPFEGHLTFNSDSRLYGPRGVYAHAFRRQGYASLGVFGYARSGNHLEGILGTYALSKRLFLLGAGASGHDALGNTRRLSIEADYAPTPFLALTGRLESLGGTDNETYPVAALTYYPFNQNGLRLTAETVQQKANRSVAVSARVQF